MDRSRSLYMYVSSKALEKPHVKAFVEFYIRKAATELISDVGYVATTDQEMQNNLTAIGLE
ncbi:MAG: hypothetical protein KGY99_07710 [Phycisphaerae bacterium]|nr:hypothetical protein [Phycisphaerae bacterium]